MRLERYRLRKVTLVSHGYLLFLQVLLKNQCFFGCPVKTVTGESDAINYEEFGNPIGKSIVFVVFISRVI